jgi:hypothetical protein
MPKMRSLLKIFEGQCGQGTKPNVGRAGKPRLELAEAGGEEWREEEETRARGKGRLEDVVVLEHAREREVEEENAHSEFEEHGEEGFGEGEVRL